MKKRLFLWNPWFLWILTDERQRQIFCRYGYYGTEFCHVGLYFSEEWNFSNGNSDNGNGKTATEWWKPGIRHQDCYPTASRLRFEPGPFCAWVQHANHSATEPPYEHVVTVKRDHATRCVSWNLVNCYKKSSVIMCMTLKCIQGHRNSIDSIGHALLLMGGL